MDLDVTDRQQRPDESRSIFEFASSCFLRVDLGAGYQTDRHTSI